MMIPRPKKGVAGNGFNLQDAMGLADDGETYNLLRVSPTSMRTYLSLMIVACCTGPISQSRARLCSSVHRQPKELISKIIGAVCVLPFYFLLFTRHISLPKNTILQARQRHSHFKKFPHGWPIEEFLKSNLKNKRAYARRRGYLGDQTNRDREWNKGGEGSDDGNDDDEGAGDNGSDGASSKNKSDNGASDESGDDDDQGGNDDRTDDYGDYDGAGGYDGASDDEAEDGLEYYSDE